MYVIKKDGRKQDYDRNKIIVAIQKSADRALYHFSEEEIAKVLELVETQLASMQDEISVLTMHSLVENALDYVAPEVAKSYRDYRNFKNEYANMMDRVNMEANRIQFLGDRENSNADSTLVSTKRTLIMNALNKELYMKFQLNQDELQAIKDGYIYIHDMSARRDTMNCCLFRLGTVLNGGFEMSNMWYNEPKSIDTAFDVTGDIILMAASQQYGGFTVPEIDTILAPYAEKSYLSYLEEYRKIAESLGTEASESSAQSYAKSKTIRDIEQGYQGIEYKLNTVASSRGDYPFITFSFGIDTSNWGREIAKAILRVHRGGQGKKGFKHAVLFPKLVFLYDKDLHGPGCINEDVFEEGIACSAKTMYPDWLSLTGEGYIASMYKTYHKVISPMGCVDGQEIVTYKFHNQLYVESFERMWGRIRKEYQDHGQRNETDIHRVIDLKSADIRIYDTCKGFVKVNYLIRNLQNNWCDVTLTNGRKLKTTMDHPFITERGVVEARSLTSEDSIKIHTWQYAEEKIEKEVEEAWLYGFLLCDGCYDNSSLFASIAYNGENDIEEYFKKCFLHVFHVIPETVIQQRNEKGTYKDLRVYADGNHCIKEFDQYFTDLFEGIEKKERHIPNEVFSYAENARYAFLAGMIDADGYINDESNKHKFSTIQIGSINKELALQQMALAQSLHMPAKIYANHYSSKDKNKIRYRVEFFPNEELIKHMVCKKKTEKWHPFTEETKEILNSFVMKVEPLSVEQYSYDVTTESEHFEVSGVYSHNCRAFLSPYWEKGGQERAGEDDVPVFQGRFNIGAISLHLPMILAKSIQENRPFYEVLDYYLEMIRKIHCRTYEYLGHMKASCNPLAYCQGGFLGGNLDYDDKIAPLLDSATASFGITALNELQQLYNQRSLVEDGNFALEVMEYINKKIQEYKIADHHLYAIYGTPAESLCGKQIKQFRKKYGIIKNVSDREYVSNSFHCHVTETISPIQKQDLEHRFWELFNGGKIQYVRYNLGYNINAIKTLVRRAMDMGFYEGVNLALSYCDDCGYEQLDMDVCPKCGSKNITKIDRMNGYLSFSRVKGASRLNDAKMAEIKERKSM